MPQIIHLKSEATLLLKQVLAGLTTNSAQQRGRTLQVTGQSLQ